jgi:pimeloyl-ACP methyl ester carboxylesterase
VREDRVRFPASRPGISSMQIVIKNLLIDYWEQKTAGNFCLLFLHGWRSDLSVWNSILKNPEFPEYNLYAIDFPGFGKSQIPQTPMSVEDFSEVVAEFIKKLRLENVIIVGHSFGGRVGIKLSSRHPELVNKLVLVDSAAFPLFNLKKKIFAVLAKLVKPFFKPAFMQPLRKKIYAKIGAEDYVATPELQKTFINIVSEDLTSDIKKIVCPTLIIYGENDHDTPPDYGKRMQSIIPNSEFIILENAGHFSFLDQPDQFIKEIKDFIR